MSQFLFVRSELEDGKSPSGLALFEVQRPTVDRLNDIFGKRETRPWLEVNVVSQGDFSSFFDETFRSLSGLDNFGRTFVDLVRELADQYDDIVLAYGTPDSEIDVQPDLQRFVTSIVDCYSRVPIELHVGLTRTFRS